MNTAKLEVVRLKNKDVIATSVTFTFVHTNGARTTYTVDDGTTWRQWANSSDKYQIWDGEIRCKDHSHPTDNYPHYYFRRGVDNEAAITSGEYQESFEN